MLFSNKETSLQAFVFPSPDLKRSSARCSSARWPGAGTHLTSEEEQGGRRVEGRGEEHRPRAWRSSNTTPPHPPLSPTPRAASSGRCVKLAGHPPPHRTPGAGKRPPPPRPPPAPSSPLSPPPDLFFSVQSSSVSRRKEGGGGGVLRYPLPPPLSQGRRPRPAPARHGGEPPGLPAGVLPHPRPPSAATRPPPRCPPPPRDEARREGAGPRGPARSPTPRRRSGEGVTHLAVEGFHGLHVAAEAGAGRLLSADGGRAGPRPGGGLLSVCVCVCASLRGRRASSPWRLAQGAGAEGRGPRLVSVSSRQRSASSPRFPPGGADVSSPARLRSAAPAGDGGTTRSSCGAGANMADTRGLLAAQLREEPRAAQAATAPPAGRRPPAGPRHRGADGMAERTAPPAFLRAGPGRGRGAGSRRQVKGYEDKVFNAAVFRHRG